MTIAEQIYEKLKSAPPALAREVMDYLEFLEAKMKAPQDKTAQLESKQSGKLLVELMANSPLRDIEFEHAPVRGPVRNVEL